MRTCVRPLATVDAVLGLVLWLGLRLLPWVKAAVRGTERRWILLIGVALLGHLLMDAANGYGTHLFYPFSARWIYGDAVFVLEPWLWVIFGATLALNARHLWRGLVALLALGPLVALASVGLLRVGVLMAMLGVVAAMVLAARAWDERRRAAVALFPVLSGVRVLRSYHGFRPYCPDHLPVIGPDPSVAGLWHATGHEGAGIGLSVGTARAMSPTAAVTSGTDM